jgi:hypothetical protein
VIATALSLTAQVKIVPEKDHIGVEIDGKPYTTLFLSADGKKPYLYPLRTASGIQVTRHFPMEEAEGETHDHPHHRGMFFAHGDISGVNFWATEAETKAPNKGKMVLKKVLEAKGGAKSGTIKAVFDGLDPEGKPMMTETRTITFYPGPELRIIDFEIRSHALRDLKFADTKEGAETEKNVWGKQSPWVDYFGPVDGKTVGVAITDNPSNPRHPTYWHARAYGLFAANPFGVGDFTADKTKDGSMAVPAGQSVTFRYRVVIHPGDVKAANVASLYQNYNSAH